MSEIEKYIEYVNNNVKAIVKEVNEKFEDEKDNIRKKLLGIISGYLEPIPFHYEWRCDNCSWDCSGEIVKRGMVSLEQSVKELLSNEYDGTSTATYISGMGLNYNTYGDQLSYDTFEIGCNVMCSTIQRNIDEHFNTKISEKELEIIKEKCMDFDRIYEQCLAYDFFTYEFPIEYVEIEKLKLWKVLEIKDGSVV